MAPSSAKPGPWKQGRVRAPPAARGDIAYGVPGIPLHLGLSLADWRGQPVTDAAVYLWQHDPLGWSIDFDGDEVGTVTRMRGLQMSDEVGRFILTRGERSMSALFELLERLDQASLQAQRKLTIPFLKETLGW